MPWREQAFTAQKHPPQALAKISTSKAKPWKFPLDVISNPRETSDHLYWKRPAKGGPFW